MTAYKPNQIHLLRFVATGWGILKVDLVAELRKGRPFLYGTMLRSGGSSWCLLLAALSDVSTFSLITHGFGSVEGWLKCSGNKFLHCHAVYLYLIMFQSDYHRCLKQGLWTN